MSTICLFCHKTCEECRKDDKLLINPHDSRNQEEVDPKIYPRHTKALIYVLGGYDSRKNIYYMLDNIISQRKVYDTYIALPLCVWENKYSHLRYSLRRVSFENVTNLPMKERVHNLLFRLINHIINDGYLPGMPEIYWGMPRS